MEGALACYFEFKRKDVLPDFLGFLYLIRGLFDKGRMEETRNIIRELLQSESEVELINKIDTGVETESVASILDSLCEQGSIKEAVTVLNEIRRILFSIQKNYRTYPASQKLNMLHKCEAFGTDASESETSLFKVDLNFKSGDVKKAEKVVECNDSFGKVPQCHDFESYYSLIASFCSKGELEKADKLAREMLSSSEKSG